MPIIVGVAPPYRIYIAVSPTVVLWNPYDVSLKTSELLLYYKNYDNDSGYDLNDDARFCLCIERKSSSQGGGSFSTTDPRVSSWKWSRRIFDQPALRFYVPESIIPPGRSAIFSPGSETLEPMPSDSGTNTLSLKSNLLGYYYFDTNIDTDIKPADLANAELKFRFLTTHDDANPSSKQGTGIGRPMFNRSNMLFLFTRDSSGNYTIDEDNVLTQAMYLGTFTSGNASSGFAETAHGDNISTVFPLSDSAFWSSSATLAHAMKFADSSANGLLSPRIYRPTRWLADRNPRATLMGRNLYEINNSYVGSIQLDSSSPVDIQSPLDDEGGLYATVGGSWKGGGAARAALFHLPNQNERMTSITSLTHVNWVNSPVFGGAGSGPRGGRNNYPAFPLGNSYSSPFINSDSLFENAIQTEMYVYDSLTDDRAFFYDLSYYLNDALYDDYFLTGYREGDSDSTGFQNTRLKKHNNSTGTELLDVDKAAAGLMLEGAFNINSTSVDAWASFLGGSRNSTVVAFDKIFGNSETSSVSSLVHPLGGAIDSSKMNVDDTLCYTGYRSLTDSQIRWLATRMVEQVKARGPFPSLSAFINRTHYEKSLYRKDLNDEQKTAFAQSGVIQASLDSSKELEESPNRYFLNDTTYLVNTAHENAKNTEAGKGPSSIGMPAYVTQASVLGQIDGCISPRSDTFIIRSYGDSVDLDNNVMNKIMCEVVVQREPDFVSSANEAHEPINSLNKVNQKFGRKFKIVYFRWLNANDIE